MSDHRIVACALLVFALALSSVAYGAPLSLAINAERVPAVGAVVAGLGRVHASLLPEGRIAVVKRSARLLSGQDAGSASLVAELTKGSKVFIQAEAAGMVEVKLLTGQSGWLSVKELK